MLAVLALAVACGKAETRTKSQRPGGAGEGGSCPACAGEAGASALGGSSAGEGETGGTGGTGATGAGANVAGEPATGQAGSPAGEAGAPAAAEPPLVVYRITISQSLELPLMRNGEAVPVDMRPAPLVAGKQALVRAFVELPPEFVARRLIGVLDLKGTLGDDTLVAEQTVSISSTQDDLSSTFLFQVQARDLSVSTSYRLRVLEADTTPIARFPESGYTALGALRREAFKLVLVPMVANGVTPKSGEAELQGLRARMLAFLPSTAVELELAAPYVLPSAMDADGAGWDDALDDIYDLRQQAAPAHDVFYYGMLAPAASYDAYCDGFSSCILGYSNLADADDEGSRGSIGLTVFPDGSGVADAWDTLVHELGHALGRDHSPCGVDSSDTDPDFPYPSGNLGTVYGYDFDLHKLVKPKQFRDVMGYCTPMWVSDYTYRAFFERLDYIAGESFRAQSFAPPELFRVARVDLHGQSSWRGERQLAPGVGSYRAVDLLDAAGRRVASVNARLVRRDHSSGGQLWLPARSLAVAGAVAVDLSVLGGSPLPL